MIRVLLLLTIFSSLLSCKSNIDVPNQAQQSSPAKNTNNQQVTESPNKGMGTEKWDDYAYISAAEPRSGQIRVNRPNNSTVTVKEYTYDPELKEEMEGQFKAIVAALFGAGEKSIEDYIISEDDFKTLVDGSIIKNEQRAKSMAAHFPSHFQTQIKQPVDASIAKVKSKIASSGIQYSDIEFVAISPQYFPKTNFPAALYRANLKSKKTEQLYQVGIKQMIQVNGHWFITSEVALIPLKK